MAQIQRRIPSIMDSQSEIRSVAFHNQEYRLNLLAVLVCDINHNVATFFHLFTFIIYLFIHFLIIYFKHLILCKMLICVSIVCGILYLYV